MASPLDDLTPEQLHVLGVIVRTGLRRHETPKEIKAAVETGRVESNFQNLSGGDADSAGWRQERASIYANPQNLRASVNRFYDETSAVEDQYRRAGKLAAAVQRPAAQYRSRYGQHSAEAVELLDALAPGWRGGRGGGGGRGGNAGGGGIGRGDARAVGAADLGENSGAATSLLQALQGGTVPQRPSASAPAAPAFSAGATMPQGYQVPASGGGGGVSGPDIGSLLESIQTAGAGVSHGAASGGQAQGGAGGGQAGVQGRTLVVGDSLGVGTLPQLEQILGKGRVDGNVVSGRPSANGVKVLGKLLRGRSYQNIVFDLGTNDASARDLRDSLRQVVRMAPGAQIYVPTINSPFEPHRKNALLERFAAAHPNVHLVPWAAKSQGQLAGDGIHATGAGYESRAQLIARRLGWSPQPAAGAGGRPGPIHPHGKWSGSAGPALSLYKTFGKPLGLQVMSTKRHNTNPYSLDRSDHDFGNTDAFAVDMSNGSAPTPEMDEAAFRIMRALGFRNYRKGTPINTSQGVTTINGLRFQVIYRGSGDAFGGDHLDHVHLGVKRVG